MQMSMVEFEYVYFNMSCNVNDRSDLKSGDVCALYLLHVIVRTKRFCNVFSSLPLETPGQYSIDEVRVNHIAI